MRDPSTIAVKQKGLYLFGSIYPRVTGGMEIFNFYFVRNQLQQDPDQVIYASLNGVQDFERQHIPLKLIRPTRLFMPLQLFVMLFRLRKEVKYIYTGFSRESWVIPFFSALVFKLYGLRYIVTIHSGGKPDYTHFWPLRFYFRNAFEVVGVSRQICEDYACFRPGRPIHFIPPMIPFTKAATDPLVLRERYGFEAGDRIILFAGTLKPMKNPDKALKALRNIGTVALKRQRIKLLIAGQGELLPQLKQYAAAHGLEPFVTFAGLVSREQMADLYALANYYLIASDYEGMSLSLLEALFNRLPVIASRVDGIKDFLKDRESALLYPVNDHLALARCILELVEKETMAGQLGHKGYELYQGNYSFDEIIRNYSKLFKSVQN